MSQFGKNIGNTPNSQCAETCKQLHCDINIDLSTKTSNFKLQISGSTARWPAQTSGGHRAPPRNSPVHLTKLTAKPQYQIQIKYQVHCHIYIISAFKQSSVLGAVDSHYSTPSDPTPAPIHCTVKGDDREINVHVFDCGENSSTQRKPREEHVNTPPKKGSATNAKRTQDLLVGRWQC